MLRVYVCVVLCVVCCVCCVWLIPDPLPTKVTWATEARRCSVSSHGKCRTGIPLVCMRRRGGATMQRVDQERASRRTANCRRRSFSRNAQAKHLLIHGCQRAAQFCKCCNGTSQIGRNYKDAKLQGTWCALSWCVCLGVCLGVCV